ncbi:MULTISPECIES: hypothetical protein [unclassified Bradyrhizobium]|uniref:hypothetical protein n=1 Tax=unclassified Bradyrhizobium TaxID=2631580 RepID=UPI002916422E|nr:MULTISPECIES: hypothetical protein [unclassified Bradyrhizobium]
MRGPLVCGILLVLCIPTFAAGRDRVRPMTRHAHAHRVVSPSPVLRTQYVPSLTQSYGTSGSPTVPPRTYGTSGTSVGTVTAPSVGSYYWPTVGVTNAVPTWSNTNPPAR